MTESESSIQTPPIPSATARHLMPFKCVRIEILDQGGEPVMLAPENGKGRGPAVASGFYAVYWPENFEGIATRVSARLFADVEAVRAQVGSK